jgi:hypothetical protein
VIDGTYEKNDGWVRYEIDVDSETNRDLEGTDISRPVFVNDDDASGISKFRSVTVSKVG